MLKKKEIIRILTDHGVSIIESNRLLDSTYNFNSAIWDIREKAIDEASIRELLMRLKRRITWPFENCIHRIEIWMNKDYYQ